MELPRFLPSRASKDLRMLSAAAISGLSPIEKANLAQEVVGAKEVPGDAEVKALIHLYANLNVEDFLPKGEQVLIARLGALLVADKELMEAAITDAWRRSFADSDRIRILLRVVLYHANLYRLPPDGTIFGDFPGYAFGTYSPISQKVKIDTHDDHGWSRLLELEHTLKTCIHEHTHRYQDKVLVPMATNGTTPGDLAAQAQLMHANSKCYLTIERWGMKAYKDQPLERHAHMVAERAFSSIQHKLDKADEDSYQMYLRQREEFQKLQGMNLSCSGCSRSRRA